MHPKTKKFIIISAAFGAIATRNYFHNSHNEANQVPTIIEYVNANVEKNTFCVLARDRNHVRDDPHQDGSEGITINALDNEKLMIAMQELVKAGVAVPVFCDIDIIKDEENQR